MRLNWTIQNACYRGVNIWHVCILYNGSIRAACKFLQVPSPFVLQGELDNLPPSLHLRAYSLIFPLLRGTQKPSRRYFQVDDGMLQEGEREVENESSLSGGYIDVYMTNTNVCEWASEHEGSSLSSRNYLPIPGGCNGKGILYSSRVDSQSASQWDEPTLNSEPHTNAPRRSKYIYAGRGKSGGVKAFADSIHNLHTDLDDLQVVTFACIAGRAPVCVCEQLYAVRMWGGRECAVCKCQHFIGKHFFSGAPRKGQGTQRGADCVPNAARVLCWFLSFF